MTCAVLAAACSGDTVQSYDTYQECFDDKVERNMKPVIESIISCCFDHEIGGEQFACKDTAPDCINYLTANLNQVDASTVEVMDACNQYIEKRGL